jgi:hypothetical protein
MNFIPERFSGDLNLSQHLKEIFLEWSLRTNIDCYVKIFQYKNNIFAKLIWLSILIISACLTAWIILRTITTYLSYNVTSQIAVYYEIPTEFPAVTMCDTNPFSSTQAEDQFYTWFGTNWFDLDTNEKQAKMLASSPSYSDVDRRQLGLNEKQIFCMYNNQYCTYDLNWYWSYEYGNCFQFNVGLNLTKDKIGTKKNQAHAEGINYGLQIFIPTLTNNNSWTRYYDSGMVVFIHNSSFRPLMTDAVFLKVIIFILIISLSLQSNIKYSKLSIWGQGTDIFSLFF